MTNQELSNEVGVSRRNNSFCLQSSVKIEQSAKGARITVHVNANKPYVAMEQAISLYRSTKLSLENLNEMVAPIEVKV